MVIVEIPTAARNSLVDTVPGFSGSSGRQKSLIDSIHYSQDRYFVLAQRKTIVTSTPLTIVLTHGVKPELLLSNLS